MIRIYKDVDAKSIGQTIEQIKMLTIFESTPKLDNMLNDIKKSVESNKLSQALKQTKQLVAYNNEINKSASKIKTMCSGLKDKLVKLSGNNKGDTKELDAFVEYWKKLMAETASTVRKYYDDEVKDFEWCAQELQNISSATIGINAPDEKHTQIGELFSWCANYCRDAVKASAGPARFHYRSKAIGLLEYIAKTLDYLKTNPDIRGQVVQAVKRAGNLKDVSSKIRSRVINGIDGSNWTFDGVVKYDTFSDSALRQFPKVADAIEKYKQLRKSIERGSNAREFARTIKNFEVKI